VAVVRVAVVPVAVVLIPQSRISSIKRLQRNTNV